MGPAAGDGRRYLALTAAAADLGDAAGGAHLEPVPQPLGGIRWWLRCPACGTRRAALYLTHWTGARLRCRVCFRLAYTVERYDMIRRTEHRMRQVVRRLGVWLPDALPDLPPKPPRMHWRTYNRLADAYDAADGRRNEEFNVRLVRLLRWA